jgi:colanic acid/amylovoran biosynthesis glycosyltransferase
VVKDKSQALTRDDLPRVLIYREELLRISETFIKGQAEALTRYQPIYLGLRKAQTSLALAAPAIQLNSGPFLLGYLRANAYRHYPWAPLFHGRLKRLRPSLLHVHFATDATHTLAMNRLLRVPLLVTLHGYDIFVNDEAFAQTRRGRLFLRLRSSLWAQAALVLCVSEAVRKQALAAGIPESKLAVHYTGVDTAALDPAPASARDQKLVVFVGRLVEKKGCSYLIEALAKLASLNVRLEVIGDGPLRAPLEELAARLGVRARFLGAQPTSVVLDRMARARVFCGPSIRADTGDSEGFGMVFADAQALGTPVVSSMHSAIPEVVLHGQTGLLAPERDADALSQHLQMLLENDALWSTFHHRGIEHVRRSFDLTKQTIRLQQLYDSALDTEQHPDNGASAPWSPTAIARHA